MNIKIRSLRSSISESKILDPICNEYLASLKKVGDLELDFIDSMDMDPFFFLVETGGTEEIFIKLVDQIDGPCYLLTTGMNNSLAASIEIETYMHAHNKECLIIHGTYEKIVNDIKGIMDDYDEGKSLHNQRLGVIGKPSNWLIASMVNYHTIKEKTGITLVDISSEEFEKEINLHQHVNNERMDELLSKWDNKEEMNISFDIYAALKRLAVKYNLNGLTVRCFDLLGKYRNTSCLALALLNDEGITATCEGDVPTMITMHLASRICGVRSFQANPARIDAVENTMIFAHCTIPFTMINNYSLFTHFESNLGIAIRGQLELKQVTVLRFNNDLSRMFVSLGTIEENLEEDRLCRTQIRVKLAKDVNYFLKSPCGNHHVIIYGNHVEEVVKYCNKIKCEVI